MDTVRSEVSIGAPPQASRLSVHVLATTVDGTRAALRTARRLTRDLDGRVVLLLPCVQTLSSAYDPAERTRLVERYQAMAGSLGIDATVLFCLCHRLVDVVHQMLGHSSLVLVGGRRNPVWASREERLASRLTGEGYPVVFVPCETGREAAPS
jgi:hypothetical protein